MGSRSSFSHACVKKPELHGNEAYLRRFNPKKILKVEININRLTGICQGINHTINFELPPHDDNLDM